MNKYTYKKFIWVQKFGLVGGGHHKYQNDQSQDDSIFHLKLPFLQRSLCGTFLALSSSLLSNKKEVGSED